MPSDSVSISFLRNNIDYLDIISTVAVPAARPEGSALAPGVVVTPNGPNFRTISSRYFFEEFEDEILTITESSLSSFKVEKDFFKAADTFSMEFSGEENLNLIKELKKRIKPGQPVVIHLNEQPKLTGFVDSVELSISSGGVRLSIRGRDKLGVVIDSCLTPDTRANPKDTLLTALQKGVAPFGFSKEDLIFSKEEESRLKGLEFKDNAFVGTWAERTARRAFQDPNAPIARTHRAKKSEGCIQFCRRICDMNGLFLNLSPDGEKIIISPPVYDRSGGQKFVISHRINPELFVNNIISSDLQLNFSDQMSVIIVEGTSGGGQFRKQTSKTIVVNDLIGYDDSGNITKVIQNEIEKNTSASRNIIPKNDLLINNVKDIDLIQINSGLARPGYIYNSNTNNKAELEFFARRKMADMQAKSFQLRYKLQNFTNDLLVDKPIWSNNMLVSVTDELLGLDSVDLWISKVSYSKSRSGTFTEITCQLPYIYDYI